jgi:hypothetical protein
VSIEIKDLAELEERIADEWKAKTEWCKQNLANPSWTQ